MNFNKNTSVVVTILLVVVIAVVVGVLVWQFKPTEEALSKSQEVVKDYGEAMTTRKKGKVVPYTTGELEEEVQGWLPVFGTSNPHPDGIKVLSSKKIGDNKFKIKARLFEAYTGEGRIGYRDNIYTVKKERGKYLISTVEPGEYISISEEADALQEVSVTVTSPNGGEQWKTGETYNITWNSSKLERAIVWLRDYSKGINFKACRLTDTYVEANKGEFTWKVDSKNCKLTSEVGDKFKIAVTEPEGMARPHFSDTSDDFFSIKSQEGKSITVTSPNGGEEWKAGEAYDIKWDSSGVDKVNIEYGNGKSWRIAYGVDASKSEYSWEIPEDIVESYSGPVPEEISEFDTKVLIWDADKRSVSDKSDNTITIVEGEQKKEITVTSPNGGEQWKTGETYNITWNSSELERAIVWLRDYSKGTSFKACRLTDTYVEADKGKFTWEVGSENCELTSGDKFKIAVTAPEGVTKPHLSDTSDDFFSVKSQEGKSITVTSPNGGEEWDRQEDHSITWTSSFGSEEKVKLAVTHNDVPSTLITQTSDTGSYNWSIDETQIGTGSTLPAGSNYKIKICSLKDNSACDTSDDYFKVVE